MKILEVAEKEIGTKESPENSNNVKYNTWFYGKDVSGATYAWCGVFVSWCFAQAGIPLGTIDFLKGFAGTNYAVKNVSKWGSLVTIPQVGDVVFYDWQGDGKFDHAGLFVKDLGKGFFEAIEGNTAFKNDSNGGEVMRRADRKYKYSIFVRPNVLNPIV